MRRAPQLESVVNALGTAVAERLANGTNRHGQAIATRRIRRTAPPAAPTTRVRWNSPDRWVVVACRDDAEWMRWLACWGTVTSPKTAGSTRLSHPNNEDELEGLINSWTAGWKAEDLCAALQAAGVPAGVVQNAQDMLDRTPT
ncbi:CoA transferase [Candidatus Amarobacter glycogenicus]|uniref:CoA transferase n=1 Tax=Candidatus Amarobacter glycogenicus TaxID=3140699 RepID=UPI0031CC736A